MFLAIINDSYVEVKTELAQQKSKLEVADYVKQVKGLTGFYSCRNSSAHCERCTLHDPPTTQMLKWNTISSRTSYFGKNAVTVFLAAKATL